MDQAARATGIVLLVAYVGILVWAIGEWPFTVIVLGVGLLLALDLVRTRLARKAGTGI